MVKLGSDKKPHRQTSGKAPIEGGDAEEDLMYLWSDWNDQHLQIYKEKCLKLAFGFNATKEC